MSVPSYKRSDSTIQYLKELYDFNVRIGEICMNSPKKYRMNYADSLIKDSLDAFKYARLANNIYVSKDTKQEDIELRKSYLNTSIGLINHVVTTAMIFLDLMNKADKIDYEKISSRQQDIGDRADKIINLIKGVIKSDKRRF